MCTRCTCCGQRPWQEGFPSDENEPLSSQLSGADHLSLPHPAEHITYVYVHADDGTHFPQSSATSSWIFCCSQMKAARMALLHLEQGATVMCWWSRDKMWCLPGLVLTNSLMPRLFRIWRHLDNKVYEYLICIFYSLTISNYKQYTLVVSTQHPPLLQAPIKYLLFPSSPFLFLYVTESRQWCLWGYQLIS